MDNASDMTATLVKVKLRDGALLCSCRHYFFEELCFLTLCFVLVQVDSANKYGTLLEVVQVLTDLKLTIKRGYISSDGEWVMDGE